MDVGFNLVFSGFGFGFSLGLGFGFSKDLVSVSFFGYWMIGRQK